MAKLRRGVAITTMPTNLQMASQKKKELKNGEDMDKTSQMAETTKDEMSLTTHATKNKALETM